jgi:stage VI sporulation protein D
VEQLRFNISEKIRLHPQQSGIGSLLELDLYPDVEIKDEGQHLKIQGYLRLNGSYEGDLVKEVKTSANEDDLLSEEISYVIPVEITLPRDRAELACVLAEVESFDYQLLSPFELQIEAVLMIDGILPEQEQEELITEISEEEESPTFSAQPAQLEETAESLEETPESLEETAICPDPIHQEVERPIYRETKRITYNKEEEQQEVATTPVLEAEGKEQLDEIDVPTNIEEEVRGREWSRWLIGSKEDTFVPIKMVIVQKDESIDTLAVKYEISCDEILRTNQFATDRLIEGQLVKIPVRRN